MTETEKKEKIEHIKLCPKCSSTHLFNDYSRAELICKNCGLVIDAELIDHGPEWRAFDSEQRDKKARTGAPMNYAIHNKGLSTMISWQNRDAYGRTIPTKNRGQLYRLRKWQRRTQIASSSERSLSIGFAEISRISSQMSLPRTIREQAGMLYRKAAGKNLIRGRGIESIVAAVMYAACRLAGMPRTLDEIADFSRSSRKEIGRTYRFIARKLELKINVPSPMSYVPRFCSELNLSQDVKKKATDILKDAIDKELASGRGPVGLSAASIYIASCVLNEKGKTQKEIAEVAGVTEVTIRNRYKEIARRLGIDVNS